jgi:predicted nuclease of predicted toxin-antitoxin system
MRFLADTCLERDIVVAMRQAGYEVSWMLEISPRLDDETVLEQAQSEGRVLLTNDVGFGERVSRSRDLEPGIVLFRFKTDLGAKKVARILDQLPVLAPHLSGHFAVLTDKKTRLIPLRRGKREDEAAKAI